MKCKNCSFVVPSNMRFCLMKNMCPSCGSPLFSNHDMNHLSMLQNRIMSQSFAESFEQTETFDLALFIYNEILSGYGRTVLDEELKKLSNSASPALGTDVLSIQDEEPSDLADQVRREVAAEYKEQLPDDSVTYSEEEDDDEEDRVERLKAQAKRLNKRKTGTRVVRAG